MRFLVSVDVRNYSRVIYSYKGIIFSRELNKEYIPFKKRALISDNYIDQITELYFVYQNNCHDLEGIDELKNLKIIKINGALGDMTSLLGCKKLEEIYIGDSSIIYDLECLIRHPSLKIIKLGGNPQYSEEYFKELVKIFKTKDIELCNDKTYNYQYDFFDKKSYQSVGVIEYFNIEPTNPLKLLDKILKKKEMEDNKKKSFFKKLLNF